jgi:hypothetical protein
MTSHPDEAAATEYGDTAPTVEVVVYQHGKVVHRELCESEEAAADVVDEWSELDGVECIVDDLGVQHVAGEILEPELAEPLDEVTYPPTSTESE